MFYIVIVSHNNNDYIRTIISELVSAEAEEHAYKIIIRDNVDAPILRDICTKNHVSYMPSLSRKGFAENNNAAVECLLSDYDIAPDDYFLFMNPDAFITKESLNNLITIAQKKLPDMFTIDLYLDKDMTKRDPSVRRFPHLTTFFSSFILNKNNTIIDRDNIDEFSTIDWCASSFFGVKVSNFKALRGFDAKYFMYCEDVDFCYRAHKLNMKLTYFPQIKAVHYAQQNSHKIISRNFYWHLCSVIRYSILKPIIGLTKKDGC